MNYNNLAKIFIAVGIITALLAELYAPTRMWAMFLLNSTYFLTLALGATFFLALHYVTGSHWSEVLRRIPESLGSYIPVGGCIMLIVFFGMHVLYHWIDPHALMNDHVLQGKIGYLNQHFFFIRLIAVILIWFSFWKALCFNSHKFDEIADTKYYHRNRVISVVFIFVFAITVSFMTFDWIMSLEPHWYSTMFAVYNFSGMFVNALAVVTLIAIMCKEKEIIPELTDNHFHDLGKLVFAFSCFWAYIWFSQLLLIWYGNIPEETIYFVRRLQNDFRGLFYSNVIINFAIPFFALLPRGAKRNRSILKKVCLILLIGRWLDLYLMIAPGVLQKNASLGFVEIGITLGFAGLFFIIARRFFIHTSFVPRKSPYLEYSLTYHQ